MTRPLFTERFAPGLCFCSLAWRQIPPPNLCPIVHVRPTAQTHRTQERGIKSPPGAEAPPAQPRGSHHRNAAAEGKATQQRETPPGRWAFPGPVRAPRRYAGRAVIFYQSNRRRCSGSPRAGGKRARRPTLRHCSRTPSPTLRPQPRRRLHPTSSVLAGHQARIVQNAGHGSGSPLPGYPGEDGDCPRASERRGQRTRFATGCRFLRVLWYLELA